MLSLNSNGSNGARTPSSNGARTPSSNGARTPSSNGARTPSLVTKASNTATAIYPRVAAAGAAPSEIPRWKRILDVTCILLTLPFWLPLMILIMGAIRFISPGPIFYHQERVGYRRKRFMIFKFRTMHVNTETRTHEEYFAHLMRVDCPMVKLDGKGDSRLIACGRFLRASGLDELPQIFNVLRGEMSLVGPRPCLPHEFQRYETWQQQRVSAPPGLTGYWQVNGKNKTTFNEMIAMDIFYARNMSVWLDLTIMLKTIPALIEQVLESRRKPGRESPRIYHQTLPSSGRLNGAVKKI
jgi:lipopolysaccharide/colanic/teichoic acid biosynthesis glycosyltransferase